MKQTPLLSGLLALLLLAGGGTLLAAPPGAGATPGDHLAGPGHPPFGGTEGFLARHDLDGDGTVTAEEFGRTDPRFRELDQNGDGVVTRAEHDAAVANLGNRHGGMMLLAQADADGDHTVTAAEWSAFLGTLDGDGDGQVDDAALAPRRRFPVAMTPPPGFAEHRAERLRTLLDRNGDGLLEVDEAAGIFAELDVNGDGQVSGDELPPMRPFRQGFHGAPPFPPRGSAAEREP